MIVSCNGAVTCILDDDRMVVGDDNDDDDDASGISFAKESSKEIHVLEHRSLSASSFSVYISV